MIFISFWECSSNGYDVLKMCAENDVSLSLSIRGYSFYFYLNFSRFLAGIDLYIVFPKYFPQWRVM